MRLEVFSSRSRGLGIDSRLETRDFQGRLFFSFGSPALRKSKVFESIRSNNYLFEKTLRVTPRPSQSVRRAYDAHVHHLLLPTSSNVSRSRREAGTTPLVAGASRCSLASGRRERRKPRRHVARKQSFQRKLSRARALRLDARDARRERRGRRVVTRARRARRARLRASRPVAARAASRTRFGTSSRRVSVKARREACFTRFAFSRVLFFRF